MVLTTAMSSKSESSCSENGHASMEVNAHDKRIAEKDAASCTF